MRCRVTHVTITNSSNSKQTKIYTLNDTGSDAILMSIAVAKKLELHGYYRMLQCQGINGTHHIRAPFVGVTIKGIGHGQSHLFGSDDRYSRINSA